MEKEGVENLELEINDVPESIQNIIKQMGGEITTFMGVKIGSEVPRHKHEEDGEIYFGGKRGITTIKRLTGEEVQVELSADRYSITKPGESHGVTRSDENDTTPIYFFGVKYKIPE